MKIANFLLACLLLFGVTISAQDIGEPYPAPVSYAELSETEKIFFGLFEDKNVGNLHVYAPAELPAPAGYFYLGQPITSDFKNLLPKQLQPYTNIQDHEPHAVYTVKGAGREFFIIRSVSPENNVLGLYARYNNTLDLVTELAGYEKTKKGFTQTDTWIKDLNRDGRLDLVKKIKTVQGNKVKIKTKVFLQNAQGQFKRTRTINLDPLDYIMQE